MTDLRSSTLVRESLETATATLRAGAVVREVLRYERTPTYAPIHLRSGLYHQVPSREDITPWLYRVVRYVPPTATVIRPPATPAFKPTGADDAISWSVQARSHVPVPAASYAQLWVNT